MTFVILLRLATYCTAFPNTHLMMHGIDNLIPGVCSMPVVYFLSFNVPTNISIDLVAFAHDLKCSNGAGTGHPLAWLRVGRSRLTIKGYISTPHAPWPSFMKLISGFDLPNNSMAKLVEVSGISAGNPPHRLIYFLWWGADATSNMANRAKEKFRKANKKLRKSAILRNCFCEKAVSLHNRNNIRMGLACRQIQWFRCKWYTFPLRHQAKNWCWMCSTKCRPVLRRGNFVDVGE